MIAGIAMKVKQSVHVRFGDLVFNLLAVESGEHVNLEKAMCSTCLT